jgi:hypothetical protein
VVTAIAKVALVIANGHDIIVLVKGAVKGGLLVSILILLLHGSAQFVARAITGLTEGLQ